MQSRAIHPSVAMRLQARLYPSAFLQRLEANWQDCPADVRCALREAITTVRDLEAAVHGGGDA